MKKNVAFMSLAMVAMMAEANFGVIPTQEPRIPNLKREPKEVIPKGCKQYFFTESGYFFYSIPSGSYTIVYDCIASNDKNAIKKFNKFKETNEKQKTNH